MEKSFSFMKGMILGVVVGILGMGGGQYLAGELKVNLLTLGTKIINVHEHIESIAEVPKLLQTMSNVGIKKMILVGSPEQTIRFEKNKNGFTGYEENNEEILNIAEKYPENFIAFPTIDPADPEKLEKLQDYVSRGAKGLKLYSGHGFFYQEKYPLDEKSMLEVYKYCEENGIPILFHVNLSKYENQFLKVLEAFPKLKINCPHFCLSSTSLQRLGGMFDKYPNLYTDISFGYKDYVLAGFDRMSAKMDKFKEFIAKYSDRFMYGTDTVITAYEGKSVDWLTKVFQGYRDLLEEEQYNFFLKQEKDSGAVYNGLSLEPEVLNKIYEENYKQLFEPAK